VARLTFEGKDPVAADQTNDRREGFRRLAQIAGALKEGAKVNFITARELLRWFGAERRNDRTIFEISTALRNLDLRTEPWFEDQFIDGPLEFHEGYFGGSHLPSGTEKMVLDLVEEHFQKEEPRIGQPATKWEANYLNTLWIRLINRRLEAWVRERPEGNVTREQVQAKVDALARLGGLEQFTEQEIREEQYIMNLEAEAGETEVQVEDSPLQGEEPLRLLPIPDFAEAAKVIPFPSGPKVINETTFRIRRLASANNPPVRIEPNRSVIEAITTMLLRDFSQLPVMNGERER
jgi:hypothetical protein